MLPVIVILVAVVLVILLAGAFSRAPEEAFKKARLTFVAEATDGEPCMLVGTARSLPGRGPLISPLTGREALLFKTVLERSDEDPKESGAPERLEIVHCQAVSDFLLEDETGVALVRPFGSGDPPRVKLGAHGRCTLTRVPVDKLTTFLQGCGKSLADVHGLSPEEPELPPSFHLLEHALVEGDRLLVVGRCALDAGSAQACGAGDAGKQVVVAAPKGRILFISSDEQVIAEFARRAMGRTAEETGPRVR